MDAGRDALFLLGTAITRQSRPMSLVGRDMESGIEHGTLLEYFVAGGGLFSGPCNYKFTTNVGHEFN